MDDFNKELSNLKKLAGLGQGIYDNSSQTVKKTQGVGDGLAHLNDIADAGVSESQDSGTNSNKEVTKVDAENYFPSGDHNDVSDEAGPASAKQGDNPLQKKLKESYGNLLAELQSHFYLLNETSESSKQTCQSCGSTECSLHEENLTCENCGTVVESLTDFADNIYASNIEYDNEKISSYNKELIESEKYEIPDELYDSELSTEEIKRELYNIVPEFANKEKCCDVLADAVSAVSAGRNIGPGYDPKAYRDAVELIAYFEHGQLDKVCQLSM